MPFFKSILKVKEVDERQKRLKKEGKNRSQSYNIHHHVEHKTEKVFHWMHTQHTDYLTRWSSFVVVDSIQIFSSKIVRNRYSIFYTICFQISIFCFFIFYIVLLSYRSDFIFKTLAIC